MDILLSQYMRLETELVMEIKVYVRLHQPNSVLIYCIMNLDGDGDGDRFLSTKQQ